MHYANTYLSKPVVPDVEITQNIQDILDKRDVQLEWVKAEIEKERENKKIAD